MSHTMAYHFPVLGAPVLGRELLSAGTGIREEPLGPTVEEFVARVFVPKHVATKRLSGRAHYRAMLKHLITPQNVDRIFDGGEAPSRSKLKGVPGWPYVGGIPLSDIRPDHVRSLIEAAIAHGYSTQTVAHIRRAVSAIFSCARRTGFFAGENPAAETVCPEVVRERDHVLTLDQTRAALQAMRYPEKEMTLIALLTGMNLAEVCGLRWGFVNMTSSSRTVDGELIAPRSISARTHKFEAINGSPPEKTTHRTFSRRRLARCGCMSATAISRTWRIRQMSHIMHRQLQRLWGKSTRTGSSRR